MDWAKSSARQNENHLSLGLGAAYIKGFTAVKETSFLSGLPLLLYQCLYNPFKWWVAAWKDKYYFLKRNFHKYSLKLFYLTFIIIYFIQLWTKYKNFWLWWNLLSISNYTAFQRHRHFECALMAIEMTWKSKCIGCMAYLSWWEIYPHKIRR